MCDPLSTLTVPAEISPKQVPHQRDYDKAFNILLQPFEQYLRLLPETRQGKNITYNAYDFALSAFTVFFMQEPSFLAHQRFLAIKQHRHNLQSLFKVDKIPSDSQIRRGLDPLSPALLHPIYDTFFTHLSAQGEIEKFRSINDTLLIPLDGVTYHTSEEVHCKQCSHRTDEDGNTLYTHQAILPVIVAPKVPHIISLPPEYITPQDGTAKQDCEIAAAKRWLEKHGPRYLPLGVTFLGDDLYAHQPFCQAILEAKGHFIFTAKPTSHKTLYEWITPVLDTTSTVNDIHRRGKKKWFDTYRFINQVPLRDGADALLVNWFEIVTRNAQGHIVYRSTFVTDHLVTVANVVDLVRAARARWKVENENHNTLKTKGYHLSHNFGHGQTYLASFLVSLNVLAFLFHTALHLLDAAYAVLRLKAGRRDKFFQILSVLTEIQYFGSWGALMQFLLNTWSVSLNDTS